MRQSKTAASLLATVLGDVELLGSEYLLAHGEFERLDDRDAQWWTSLLTRRFSDAVYPAMADEVEALLRTCDGDVLTLLAECADKASSNPAAALVASRFPLTMFGHQPAEEPGCLEEREVADSHLHSGGSMPLGVLLAGLATRTAPLLTSADTAAKLLFVDGAGRSWDAWTLLAAARWAMRVMWFVERGGDLRRGVSLEERGLAADLVRAVEDEAFWPLVKTAATEAGPVDPSLLRFDCQFPDDGQCPELKGLMTEWRRRQPLGAPRSDRFLLGLTRVLAAIAALATSVPGEGLSRFGDRFRTMGRAQKATFGTPSYAQWKKNFMVETIRQVAPNRQVVGAEFRRTFKADTRSSFRREVRHELAVHHAAFATFAEKQSMSLTMPVGFSRRPSPCRNPAVAARKELRHVLAGCAALGMIAEEQEGERLIDGIWSIDVAGTEIGSNNWPFQHAAALLARSGVELIFTIHAGESFVSALNGVRRVGELFMGEVHPRRIGHALALSEDASAAVLSRGQPPIFKAEAIMDLAWLCSATGSPAAAGLLEDLTRRQRPHPGIDPEAWVEAFADLHRPDRVEELLIVDVGGRRGLRPDDELWAQARVGGPVDRAIAGLVWSAPKELVGCNVAARLTDDEAVAYQEVVVSETPAARQQVLALVEEEGATIEACPTSNVTLSGLDGYDRHPIWEWAADSEKIEVSVSSDDPLHFGNNVLKELRALLETGRDPLPIERAASASVRECSGGGEKRLAGWRGYADVVAQLDDPRVRLPVE